MEFSIAKKIKNVSLYDAKPRASKVDSSAQDGTKLRVLVVALDEARVLHETSDASAGSPFRLLRQALKNLSRHPYVVESSGMIFAILVDTNCQV